MLFVELSWRNSDLIYSDIFLLLSCCFPLAASLAALSLFCSSLFLLLPFSIPPFPLPIFSIKWLLWPCLHHPHIFLTFKSSLRPYIPVPNGCHNVLHTANYQKSSFFFFFYFIILFFCQIHFKTFWLQTPSPFPLVL